MTLLSEVLGQSDVRLTLAVLTLVAFAVAWAASHRSRVGLVPAFLALTLVAGILAVTLVPIGGWEELLRYGAHPDELRVCFAPSRLPDLLSGWQSFDGPVNVVLFVPAAFVLTLVSRRPVVVLVGLLALSVGIEVWQGVTGGRSCTVSDVGANSLGSIIGVGLGVLVLALTGLAGLSDRGAGRAALPSDAEPEDPASGGRGGARG